MDAIFGALANGSAAREQEARQNADEAASALEAIREAEERERAAGRPEYGMGPMGPNTPAVVVRGAMQPAAESKP